MTDLKDKIVKLELQAQVTPLGTTCDTTLLFKILNEVEEILETKPSEAMKCLESFKNEYVPNYQGNAVSMLDWYKEQFDTIKQALLKSQEQDKENARNEEILQKYYQEGITLDSVRALKQERDKYKKAFEIIKKKNVSSRWLIYCDTVDLYNKCVLLDDKLTQEEFNLLKEGLK